jgi:HrpA-like RNA helicase
LLVAGDTGCGKSTQGRQPIWSGELAYAAYWHECW